MAGRAGSGSRPPPRAPPRALAWVPGTQHGTTAWAHVYTPAERADPASVIYLHGIVMETEMWQGIADPVTELAGRGIRVIRPEGPWHGRRRVAGLYGGEPVMARGPAGMIELFEAWIAELGALIAWARSTSNGPVAIGGVSLGALTAQLAASVAPAWPEALRPDALLLVTTTGLVLDALREGALARAIGAGDALDRGGLAGRRHRPARPVAGAARGLFGPRRAVPSSSSA